MTGRRVSNLLTGLGTTRPFMKVRQEQDEQRVTKIYVKLYNINISMYEEQRRLNIVRKILE
jgi:hypothetical protein